MQASRIYPPVSKKTALSEQELESVSKALKRLTTITALKFTIGLGILVFCSIQFPDNEVIIGQFGLIKGLLLSSVFISAPIIWIYFSSRNKLRKDLRERAKLVRQNAVIRKESSFLKKKIYAQISTFEPEYYEFEVDDSLYGKLEQGQEVRLEYTPNSKCLLKVEW